MGMVAAFGAPYCNGRDSITRSFAHKACLVVLFLLSAAGGVVSAQTILDEIHGIAFTPDGNGIMLPTQSGFMVYRARRWNNLEGARRPFGGVSVTQDAIYATERRGNGAVPPRTRGLLRSSDGGRTWRSIYDADEAEFAHMAAGSRNNAVYLVSTVPTALMREPGLYRTQDEGKTWQHAAAQDLPATIASIAVHPADPRIVAIGATDGLHVSRDAGATFRVILAGKSLTAVFFDVGGQHVYVAREGVSAVNRVSLNGEITRTLAVPIASRDSIVFIAQNPAHPHKLAVSTRLRSVFVSTNGGETWRTIAREGRPA